MSDPITAVQTRRREIARTIATLEAEDAELATAEAVLARIGVPGTRASEKAVSRSASKGTARQTRSQRDYVIEVLSQCEPAWLKSGEIVQRAKQMWGVTIPVRSLRPLLSAMKRERAIVRDGRLIALRERTLGARSAREARG